LIMVSFMAAGCCDQGASVEQQNIATTIRIHEAMSKGNVDVFDEVFTENYVRHCQAMPPEFQEMHGGEQLKAFVVDFLKSVPDYHDSLGQIFAQGDMVAYIATGYGTQTGEMNGLPASGKEFALVNIILQRFENGKIAETWITWDNVAMLSQLGFFPPPPPDDQPQGK
jgi:steroid delta-isomerase-like uncharacterized protein